MDVVIYIATFCCCVYFTDELPFITVSLSQIHAAATPLHIEAVGDVNWSIGNYDGSVQEWFQYTQHIIYKLSFGTGWN